MHRHVAEALLRALSLRPTAAASSPPVHFSDRDVDALLPLLEYEGAHIWLYRRLQQGHVTVPDGFQSALRAAVHRATVVNMRIDAQTAALTALLSAAGMEWSLLKGQARRAAAERYPYADARRVSDVDLLVPERQAEDAWQLLLSNGFRRVYEVNPVDFKADHHRPALIDASNVAVELHTTTAMTVKPDVAWRRATEHTDAVSWQGMQTRVPNATELVWQALAHGVADGYSGFKLKAFLNVASILSVQPEIEWAVIRQRMHSREVIDNETEIPAKVERLQDFLGIAAMLAGIALPSDISSKAAVDIAPLLTWRSRVLAAQWPRAVTDRLLEESGRVEARLPLTPSVNRRGMLRAIRRKVSSAVARALYTVWRATQS